MTLSIYHKKRNFKKTPEPKGKKISSKNNLYIIQKHAASLLHYDLRLELDGVLKSWAVPKGPSMDPSVKRLAVHVEDHPIEYGSFEGIIPQGEYGGGTVMLWDKGTWEEESGNARAAYKKGNLTFQLKGKKLKGSWKLIRLKNDPKNWLLIKIKDHYASDYDITQKARSVVTKRTMDEIKLISPELCTLVAAPPEGKEWLHEIKFDGYRLLAFLQDREIKLITRGQQDWSDKFPTVVAALKKLKLTHAVLDGEITVLDKNQHSSFQLLQNAIQEQSDPFVYYLFDILYYQGRDISKDTLIERKKVLKKILSARNAIIRYSDHVEGNGKTVLKKACQLGLEGIVSKNKHSTYQQKRTQDWLKTKCSQRQEFVITGFTKPEGARHFFGSLLLGVYNKNNELEYCGNVGTGFTEDSLQNLAAKFKKIQTLVMPFSKKPPGSQYVTWLKPKLVAEVEFTEWTKDNKIRHPSFKGLRSDKPPHLIKREKPKHGIVK